MEFREGEKPANQNKITFLNCSLYAVIFSIFYGQMLVLSLMSHVVYICTVLFEQINDDDGDDFINTLTKHNYSNYSAPIEEHTIVIGVSVCLCLSARTFPQ